VPKEYPVIGSSVDQEYTIGVSLLVLVVLLIPIMLCVKPCVEGRKGHGEDHDEIEFSDLNGADGQRQGIHTGVQRDSGDNDESFDTSAKNITDKMMKKRESEMKSLER
jgi:hypothetical protein